MRHLAPTTRRRTLTVLVTALSTAAAMTGLGVWQANAVHNLGIFELDGNAVSQSSDDWDKVCKAVTITNDTTSVIPDQCATAGPMGTTNTAVSWANDGPLNASIFTGGGSKDGGGIAGWGWKDNAGGLPDKDNLLDAFGARYRVDASTECPTSGSPKCDVVYFGSDRYDNSGDAQQGFWFFQNKITAVNGAFTGFHKNGDLLIVSDFNNGGSTSIINIYKWSCATGLSAAQCDSTGTLSFITGGASAKCGGSAIDAFCGTVNAADGTASPWTFLDKSGKTAYQNGELYEGGVNLSDPSINLGNECFSSIVAETRSSTSTTATLKDFVLGQFAVCSATLTTTPSAGMDPNTTAVSPGTAVHDTATLQGIGGNPIAAPTGTVSFSFCGPTDAASTALCTTGGTSAGATQPLTPSDQTLHQGQSTATSTDINTAANPLLPGRYCFRAVYSGDANYLDVLTHTGTGNSECFLVRQIPTTTVTTPSNSSGVALSGAHLGDTIFDSAVVTGTAAGGTPTGTVAFRVCDPTQVTGTVGNETCALLPTPAGTAKGLTQPLTAGSVANTAKALSTGVLLNQTGVWCFSAVYSGSSIYIGSSDNTHTECLAIPKDDTNTVTTPSDSSGVALGTVHLGDTIFDSAVVTGTAGGGTPGGTVAFRVCDPTQVTGTAGNETCALTPTPAGTAAGLTQPLSAGSVANTAKALSTGVLINKTGIWCFSAVYSGSAIYNGSSDNTHTECVNVPKDNTNTVTTPSDSSGVALGTVHLGDTIFDSAVVTGTAGGGTPGGTVAFRVCDPTQVTGTAGNETCALTPTPAGTAAGLTQPLSAGSVANTAKALSTGVLINKTGVWCFSAVYSGSSLYNGSSDNTHTECVSVPKDNSNTVTTPQKGGQPVSGTLAVNDSVTDHAVVTGTAAGGTPTGTVDFFLCNPTQVSANGGTCSSGGVSAGAGKTLSATGTADSDPVTATSVGTWCFRAVYSGDVSYNGSHDSSTGECFVVGDSSSVASTQNWLPNDSAAATSAGGTTLNGFLSFTLYAGGSCSGTVLRTAETFTLTNEASGTPHNTTNGTNNTVKVSTTTTVSWKVVFTSTDPLVSGNTHCESTSLTITN